MQGPDFDLGYVTDWRVGGDGMARVTLADKSTWSIATSARLFVGIRSVVELARRTGGPLFVAGDRRTGSLETVALPEELAPDFVADAPVDGKLAVGFHGPPSMSYLRTDRPWFAAARARLLASRARETPRGFPPPLLVTIDVVSSEIMDVRDP